MNKYYSLLLASSLIAAQPTFADLTVTTIDESGNQSVIELSNEWGKIIDQAEPNQYMMINLKNNDFYLIDKNEKMILNIGEIDSLPSMSPHSDQMQQAKPKIDIVKVGAGSKIAGYQTTHYKLTLNGEICSEHFISKEVLKHPEIKAFSLSMKQQVNSSPDMSMAFSQNPCEMAENYFDKHVFDYGVPLLSKNINGQETFKITEIKTNVTFPADEFQFPKNYETLTQAELMQREMRRSMPSNNKVP